MISIKAHMLKTDQNTTPRNRGIIQGLWSSATQLVSYIGLPVLEVEGADDGASTSSGELEHTLRAFGVWKSWQRQKADKKRVMEQLLSLSREIVLSKHLVLWVEYCECVSKNTPSPRTPRANIERRTRLSANDASPMIEPVLEEVSAESPLPLSIHHRPSRTTLCFSAQGGGIPSSKKVLLLYTPEPFNCCYFLLFSYCC